MVEQPLEQPSADESDVLAACIEAAERGDVRVVETACRRHPDLEGEIRAAMLAMQELRGPNTVPLLPQIPGIPTRIGRFEIIKELGRGGMAVVLLGQDPRLGRMVAIKLLASVPTPEALARFQRESRALASIRHPHIVALHEVGQTDQGVPYLVMDYVEGESLERLLDRLRDRAPQSLTSSDFHHSGDAPAPSYLNAIVRMASSLAAALEHAHQIGVTHRDIKPGNVLLDVAGEPYLADFGLARNLDSHTVTHTGVTPGTPRFMAPEQLNPARGDVGPRTDIYAIGVTLYHCLTLRAPFDGETKEQIFHQIQRQDPIRPRRLNPQVTRDLETIVLKAMEKDPARRYASAAELREDLEALLELRPIKARNPGPIAVGLKWIRRHPLAAAGITGALLVAIGFTSWGLIEPRIRGQRAWEEYRALAELLPKRERDLTTHQALLFGFLPVAQRGSIAAEELEVSRKRMEAENALLKAQTAYEEALARTAWLGALNDPLAQDLVGILLLRAKLSRSRKDAVEADRHTADAMAIAVGRGKERDWLNGWLLLSTSTLDSVVHLFRYEPYESLAGRQDEIPRLVPVPVDSQGTPVSSPTEGFQYGDTCLRITVIDPIGEAYARGLRLGDLIIEAGGRSVRDGGVFVTSVRADGPAHRMGVKRGDRVLEISGQPIASLWDWETVSTGQGEGADGQIPEVQCACLIEAPGGESVVLEGVFPESLVPQGMRGLVFPTQSQSRAAQEFPEGRVKTLEEIFGLDVGELEDCLEYGPGRDLQVKALHEGSPLTLSFPADSPLGVEAELTAYPLACGPRQRLEAATQEREWSLPPGSYLALIRASTGAELRCPFVLEPGAENAVRLQVPAPEVGPDGFVWIPAHTFMSQGEPDVDFPESLDTVAQKGFFISRLETSFGAWCEMLNDREFWNGVSPKAPAPPLLVGKRGTPFLEIVLGGGGWSVGFKKEDHWGLRHVGDTWVPWGSAGQDSPVVDISLAGMDLFVDWMNYRAIAVGLPWRFRLPTVEEWEMAARGVDGRSYPWGNRFDFSLCNSHFSRDNLQLQLLRLESRGRFPADESPYGVRDMGGSASEYNAGPLSPQLPQWDPLRGGSWVSVSPARFKAASRASSLFDVPDRGFRLVAELSTEVSK